MLGESLRAHALIFDHPLAPEYRADAGDRMLLAFVIVAIALFVALRAGLVAGGMSGTPHGKLLFVAALLVGSFVAQRTLVRLPFSAVGLRGAADWSYRERLYVWQVGPVATVAFAFIFRAHLAALLELHGPFGFALFSVLTGMLWGAVQEFLYRGWLQTELTRRFGGMLGLLGANVVFTFGPLHLDYLTAPGGVRWAGLAAVFGIGLFFGLVYRRSGNLWIPAVLHGLWPLNMS